MLLSCDDEKKTVLYCDAAPRSGTSIHHADKADGVHATNFGDGL